MSPGRLFNSAASSSAVLSINQIKSTLSSNSGVTSCSCLKFILPDSEESAEDLIAHLARHFDKVSEHFGYEVLPPESTVNSLGYNFLQTKPDFAYALFDLNIRNYPQSANVFDSMGDYYLAQTDTMKAIEHFKKAYDMGESPFTKEKLDALEKPE